MKTLFKDISEIRKYITVDISSNFKTIEPYIYEAKTFIIEIIGNELYSKLMDYLYNTDTTLENKYENLLNVVRYPLANYAYYLAISKLNVKVGEKGFTVVVGNDAEPASKWRIDEFRESVLQSSDNGLEELISFLENNRDLYPLWKSSSAYSYSKKFFISNASDLEKYVNYKISRTDFLKHKNIIFDTEDRILKEYLGLSFFNELKKQHIEDTLNKFNEIILENYIKPALCYSLLNEALDRDYREQINYYLQKLVDNINLNIEHFGLFKEESSYYIASDTASSAFENSEASAIYGMM